ncbi:aspartic protease 10, partial [Aphelenchoides avenae]
RISITYKILDRLGAQALRRRHSHNPRRLSYASGQSLTDYNDGEYTANVTVGDPPQAFTVLLDLNTDLFWVPDKTCANSKCPAFCEKSRNSI